jgi:hypothetical protein
MTTATEARDITRDLRTHRVYLSVTEVQKWPRWKYRATCMWLDLESVNVGEISLGTWLTQREQLPYCRICGCSDDDACEGGCIWVEPDLCNVCADASHNVTMDGA